MFSQTLGAALGDWMSDDAGLGDAGSAALFGGLLGLIAAAYFWTQISRTVLFWAALILIRPLGAALGDFLDKPHKELRETLLGGASTSKNAVILSAATGVLRPQRSRKISNIMCFSHVSPTGIIPKLP